MNLGLTKPAFVPVVQADVDGVMVHIFMALQIIV